MTFFGKFTRTKAKSKLTRKIADRIDSAFSFQYWICLLYMHDHSSSSTMIIDNPWSSTYVIRCNPMISKKCGSSWISRIHIVTHYQHMFLISLWNNSKIQQPTLVNHAGDGIPVASGRIFALGDCAKVLGTEMRFTKEGRVRNLMGFSWEEVRGNNEETPLLKWNSMEVCSIL